MSSVTRTGTPGDMCIACADVWAPPPPPPPCCVIGLSACLTVAACDTCTQWTVRRGANLCRLYGAGGNTFSLACLDMVASVASVLRAHLMFSGGTVIVCVWAEWLLCTNAAVDSREQVPQQKCCCRHSPSAQWIHWLDQRTSCSPTCSLSVVYWCVLLHLCLAHTVQVNSRIRDTRVGELGCTAWANVQLLTFRLEKIDIDLHTLQILPAKPLFTWRQQGLSSNA